MLAKMLCGNIFFLSLFDFGLSKRLCCLKALKNKCPLAVQSIAKKNNEKKLLEVTVFSWNAVLGNIYFITIAENSNIYFFYQKYTLFKQKYTPSGALKSL